MLLCFCCLSSDELGFAAGTGGSGICGGGIGEAPCETGRDEGGDFDGVAVKTDKYACTLDGGMKDHLCESSTGIASQLLAKDFARACPFCAWRTGAVFAEVSLLRRIWRTQLSASDALQRRLTLDSPDAGRTLLIAGSSHSDDM